VTQLQADISALDTSEANVLNRTKGAAETRDAKLAVVRADLEAAKTYVQHIADTGPVAQAESTIQSAGLSVRKIGMRDKAPLAAEAGDVSGSVEVVAKAAARRASYDWQYSLDLKTWVDAPSTLQAKTTISGLTPVTVYYFRMRAIIGSGQQDWGTPVSMLVK
jgi:hypothetical protein